MKNSSTDAPEPSHGVPRVPGNLNWNVSVQLAGRLVVSLARLVIASMIVRFFGAERYGEYALVFGLIGLADWICDFGLNDIFVREICRVPERRERLLRTLTAARLVQVVAAYLVLVAFLLAMGYSAEITRATLVAGVGLLLQAGIFIYRVLFRAALTLERDVLAEVLGVAAMIPLLAIAASGHASLAGIALCHVVSRLVQGLAAMVMGSREFRLGIGGVRWAEVAWGFREAAAIGAAGFLVGINEVVDTLMLSKLASTMELGHYSAAQKLLLPVVVALTSVGTTLFSALASYFGRQPERFRSTLQGGVDAVILLSAFVLSGLAGGAEFLLGLLGPGMAPAVPILRVLSIVCLVKAISATVGPVLYVTGAQRYAFLVTASATLAKIGLLLMLIPRHGAIGAALGSLAVEVFVVLVPAVLLVQRFARCRLGWGLLARVVCALVAAHATNHLVGVAGSFFGGVVAAALFALFAVLAGAFKPSDLRALLSRTPAGPVAGD